jgi:hypothetical protein
MALNKDGYSTPISKGLVGKALRQKKDEAAQAKAGKVARAGIRETAEKGNATNAANDFPAPLPASSSVWRTGGSSHG